MPDDVPGRTAVALVTALANGEDRLYRELVAELDDASRDLALHELVGFVVGLLRHYGNPAQAIAALGPILEAHR